MELKILNDLDIPNLEDFINFLIEKIKLYFLGILDSKLLIQFDNYFNSNPEILGIQNKKIFSTRDGVIGAIYCLTYIKNGKNYIIKIDPNQVMRNTTAKFIDIAKAVNYGVLGVGKYPIFTDSIDYVANNIYSYLQEYKNKGGYNL